jgi:hypothetical protein
MMNLESETPYFNWTFDKFEDLDQHRNENGFENSVWKSDVIPSYAIGEAHLTFDLPEEWGEGLPPVCFHRTSDGHYEHRSEGIAYDAVRADTETHVVLTGRWTESDFGEGVFIAVFPIKLSDEILLGTVVSLPVEGQVTAAVAQSVGKDLASTKGWLVPNRRPSPVSTPEFINRLDNIVVFKSLGREEQRRIVDIELEMVQQRIQTAAGSKPFLVNVTDTARELLLMEGNDFRYGARHLKRAIERLLVQPLSNLMASGQIQHGDRIRVSHEDGSAALMFGREPGAVRAWGIAGRAAA